MASLFRISAGKRPARAIQFTDANGERKTIRLGKCGLESAREFQRRVETLLGARITNSTLQPHVAVWVAGLGDKLHGKLAAVGLIEPRTPPPTAPTLGAWVDRYVALRTDWKESTRLSVKQTVGYLRAFFGDDRRIDSIAIGDTADWRAWLFKRGLAEASLRTHARNAKSLFNAAVEHELIARNPFRKLVSTAIAACRDRYITPEEANVILEVCPDIRWRVLFGLARFAGLRVPSESHGLAWADVDWQRGRLSVFSSKTERYKGHDRRVVPIVPKLLSLLQDAFDAADEGEECVVPLSRKNMHRMMHKILKRAGIEPWKDCFQALRRSCETELSMSFPQHAVSMWLGHSERVSEKHYLMIPDSLWDEAAGKSAAKSAAVSSRTDAHSVAKPENVNMATAHETTCFSGSNTQEGGLALVGGTPHPHAPGSSPPADLLLHAPRKPGRQ